MTEDRPPNEDEQQQNTDAETDERLPALPGEREWPRVWMAPFLRALSVLPDISSACRIARVGRTTVYDAREGTKTRAPVPGFSEAWDEALALAQDFVQRQAHTWITTGVPVRSVRTVTKRKTDAAGNTIETTTETTETVSAERSAVMMIFWLKAYYPERFRWSERAEITGAEGGPIRIEAVDELDRQIAALSAELGLAADDPDVIEGVAVLEP